MPNANVTLALSGGRFATLTDQMLAVEDYQHMRGGTADCYLVRGAVDWDAFEAALRLSETVE